MKLRKDGLRAIGLSFLTAVALTMFTAAGAQAVTWDLNGKEIAATVPVTGNVVAGQTALLLVEALGKLAIHCEVITVEDGLLLVNNTAHATLKYSKCTTTQAGVAKPKCDPIKQPITATGIIRPVLHPAGGRTFLLAEPTTGPKGNFTTVFFNEEECALPPENKVTGTVIFECYTGALVAADCKTSRVKQLIRPVVNQALHGDALLFGLNSAVLDGEAEVFMTGADLNKEFNALTP